MWTLEIENVKSEIIRKTFDEYNKADKFLIRYMGQKGVSDHHIGRMYATKDHPITTGELIEESGELFFDDSDAFHANYTITRNID